MAVSRARHREADDDCRDYAVVFEEPERESVKLGSRMVAVVTMPPADKLVGFGKR
jgi:hypothetical protein